MATEAGVDVIDTAISSLSSLTSQPSMNSVVAALEGQETGNWFRSDGIAKAY